MGYACQYATGRLKPPACKLMNGAACRHHPYSQKLCPEVTWFDQANGRMRICCCHRMARQSGGSIPNSETTDGGACAVHNGSRSRTPERRRL